MTGPATWTDELGAGRPGAVRRKASSLPGAEGRRARPAAPESDSLGSGEGEGGSPTYLDPQEPVLGRTSEAEPEGKKKTKQKTKTQV